jgi:hypothetical protein
MAVQKNVGTNDKYVRALIAAIIVALYSKEILSGTFGMILLALAMALLVTGLLNYDPFYKLFGIDTSEHKWGK